MKKSIKIKDLQYGDMIRIKGESCFFRESKENENKKGYFIITEDYVSFNSLDDEVELIEKLHPVIAEGLKELGIER